MLSTMLAAFIGSFLGAFFARWIERAQPPQPPAARPMTDFTP